MCLGIPTVDKLGSTLHPISQPITRKQRFGGGRGASWLLRILSSFYLEVLEVPSALQQHSVPRPLRTSPAMTLCLISTTPFLPQLCPWSGTLSDNWQAVAWLLIVILVGSGFQRAPSAFWAFAFVSAVPGAQLAQVPAHGGETEAPRERISMWHGYFVIQEKHACLLCF